MCGIAGYFGQNGKRADVEKVELMLSKLIHRGPDNRDTWSFENVALGYTRLSILDLTEHGNQPFKTADGTGVLIYNGEVYNYPELREELENEGVSFISTCDTEAVLYALHKWGPEKAVRKFNGMFAFAYYDLRSRSLWLGRDQAGIKPLYIARSNSATVFASEMKALFAHPAITCRPDLHTVTGLIIETRRDRLSPFENVQEIRPGTLLKIEAKSEKEIIWFDLFRDLETDRLLENENVNFETWLTRLDEILPQCVASHLASDVPLAVMSSGGVDSSLITAFAGLKHPGLVAYVADDIGLKERETDRARRACNHLGVELRTVPLTRADYMRLWPKAAWHYDEPIYFRQNILHLAIAERVKQDGFKVLLCGEGADELFGGYEWQTNIYDTWRVRRKRYRLLKLLGPLRKLFKKLPYYKPLLNLEQLKENPFAGFTDSEPGKLAGRQISAIGGGERVLLRRAMFNKFASFKTLEESAFLTRSIEDYNVHLGTSLKCNDKMNMACSVESRVPFLDKRLIDFAMHLPVSAKYSNGVSKPLLKASASKRLPKDLMYKKKIGFDVSVQMWNNTLSLLDGGWVENWLKWRSCDREEIKELIQRDNIFMFHLISIELWARIYFGHEKQADLTEKLLAAGNNFPLNS